ncbi:SDR family oxidoreductase [Bosea sp. TWI1241]|jgi:NAD(P)-dependent dehydrogenase (short-subunit alcohol dehydrogenase family)|uniref:SDR family NAD(P)-dependent oxidoreductase n=1 Tax=Bosea sp. TWI1241 TaxID=3148904 RepID=UPI0032090230
MSILDRFRLDGEVAIVTGGASGIGAAVAEALTEAGATVVIADRSSEPSLDVTDEAAVDAFFDDVVKRHGRLDVLINNAGIAIRRPTLEISAADWNSVVSVNMTGMFLCARAAARHMLPAGGGRIVNTASVMGLSGGLYPNAPYQTTKGAIVNMTRALAVEWAQGGIRVNAVAPWFVRTGLTAQLLERPGLQQEVEAATPMGRLAEVEEVAGAFLYLASPASGMVTGHTLPVDGGFLAR